MDEQLMTPREVAELLRMTAGAFKAARSRNTISIPCVRIGKKTLYRKADVLAWLDSQTVR